MNEAALRARSLTLADGQVVVPIEDVLELAATPSGGPLDRIHALRQAIEEAVRDLNEAWGGFGPNEQLEHAIGVLQRARTADDIAQGRDWPPVVLGTETQRPAATPSGGPLDDSSSCGECGHALAAHATVTNDGCMVEECLCDATPSGGPLDVERLAEALYLALGWSGARYNPNRAHAEDWAMYDPIPQGIVSGDRDNPAWADLTARVAAEYARLTKDAGAATPSGGPLDVERLRAFASLLEAEWYNGNMDEGAYERLNSDIQGILAARLTEDAG